MKKHYKILLEYFHDTIVLLPYIFSALHALSPVALLPYIHTALQASHPILPLSHRSTSVTQRYSPNVTKTTQKYRFLFLGPQSLVENVLKVGVFECE